MGLGRQKSHSASQTRYPTEAQRLCPSHAGFRAHSALQLKAVLSTPLKSLGSFQCEETY